MWCVKQAAKHVQFILVNGENKNEQAEDNEQQQPPDIHTNFLMKIKLNTRIV